MSVYARTIDKIGICALTPEQKARTCGYWYTLSSASTAETAFRTRQEAVAFMEIVGIGRDVALGPEGVWEYHRPSESYRVAMHTDPSAFDAIIPVATMRKMSNGQYTLGKVTQDADGFRTIHILNPNCDRVVFDYQESQRRAAEGNLAA